MKLDFGLGEQGVQGGDLAAHHFNWSAPGDAGAQIGHGAFDADHQGMVAGRQCGFDRLEAIEIGGQGQIVGGLVVLALIGGQGFVEAPARDGQRAAGALGCDRFGMAAHIGDD